MKKLICLAALVAAVSVHAATTTNYVGTIATRQNLMAMVCPQFDFQWETNIIQDTEGGSYERCAVTIANWLANSTTNTVCSFSNETIRVNGQTGRVCMKNDGRFSLGGLEDWQSNESGTGLYTPKITIEEKYVGYDRVVVKWRYYRYYYPYYREFTMKLTATPRWRFALPASP